MEYRTRFHLLSIKAYIVLDTTQGHVNFLKGYISLLIDTELIIDYASKPSFPNVLLVWHGTCISCSAEFSTQFSYFEAVFVKFHLVRTKLLL